MEFRIAILVFFSLIEDNLTMNEEVTFNRKLTGVNLTPYVQAEESSTAPGKSSYTSENLRTMLQVVSTKFSKILVHGMDTYNVSYKKNDTYYNGANIAARIAETAAYINRERGNLSLMVTIGMDNYPTAKKRFVTEMEVALEATRKAQSIFSGTVEGLIVWDWNALLTMNTSKGILSSIKTIRKNSANPGLRIGILEICERSLRRSVLRADSSEFFALKKEILFNLDFIACSTDELRERTEQGRSWKRDGVTATFNRIESQILAQRLEIQSLESNIQVMWYTHWIQSNKIKANDTTFIEEVRDYFLLINKFATQHNFAGWIFPAIGYAEKGYLGWWRLKRQELINDVSGYAECTLDSPSDFDDTTNTDIVSNETISKSQTNSTNNDEASVEKMPESRNETNLDLDTSQISKDIEVDTVEVPNSNKHIDDGTHTLWKYVAIIIGSLFLVTLFAMFSYLIIRKRKTPHSHILTKQEIHEFKHGASQNDYKETRDEIFVNETALRLPYDILLEIPKDKLEIWSNEKLGGGEFGCVVKALVRDETDTGTEVALKTAKPNSGATVVKGLLSEIKILSYLGHHPNIVPILGAYTAEMCLGTVYIATELCPMGSLKKWLVKSRNDMKGLNASSVPIEEMIRWSNEIASGMEYLEEKGVIHADLATRNVLLSAERTARITDFGLSRRLYEYTNYTKTSQEPLPWRWMAFESLKMMEFSPKSDVWSYGVTLWEIFSLGAQPYPGIGWTVDFVESLESGLRLRKPKYASQEIFDIMETCWFLDPDARPSFRELNTSTRRIQTSVMERLYTLLSVCPEAAKTTAESIPM